MTSLTGPLRSTPRAALRDEHRGAWTGWAAAAITSAWSVALGALLVGRLADAVLAAAVLGLPILLGMMLLFGRQPATRPLKWSAAWAGTAASSAIFAIVIPALPVVAVAIPGLAVSALVLSRFPAAGVVLAFAFTGSYGTLIALTPVPVGELVDVILAGVLGGVLLTHVLRERNRPIWIWPGVVAPLLFLGLAIAWVLAADDVSVAAQSFRASSWYMLAFFVIAYAGWKAPTYDRIARGIIVVAAAVGAYATLRWIIGPADAERDLAVASVGTYNTVGGEVRLVGSFPTGHELGAWTAALIPFCCGFALIDRSRWRIVAAVAAGLCGVGMLGSEVRTALVAAAIGVALVVFLYQVTRGVRGLHLGATAAMLVAAIGVGAAVFSFTIGESEESTKRYTSLLEPVRDPAFQARTIKWETALEDIEDGPLGYGLGSAGRINDRHGRFSSVASVNIDNSYLKVAYEQGFAVMVFYILALTLLLAGLARKAALTVARRKAALGIGAAGTLASFMVLMFTALYIEGLPALAVWTVVGLGVAPFAFLDPSGAQRGPGRSRVDGPADSHLT